MDWVLRVQSLTQVSRGRKRKRIALPSPVVQQGQFFAFQQVVPRGLRHHGVGALKGIC
jgi:hypothetical protein